MKKSPLLMDLPAGVVSAMGPDPIPGGTTASTTVAFAESTKARVWLKVTLLLAGTRSKFVPLMATWVPTVPMAGLNPVMTGASGAGPP